jgi:TP901 family phage tail tape measure protein
MFDKSFTHIGIMFTAVNNASGTLKTILNDLGVFEAQTDKQTQRIQKNFSRLFDTQFGNSAQGIQNLKNKLGREFDELQNQFDNFNRETRRKINNYTSMIMAGVALSMSGITIKRAGQSVLGMIQGWTTAASEFGKVMAQIKFLGNMKNQREFNKMEDKITKMGIELPGSNVDIAKAVLIAKKTGYTTNESVKLARNVQLLSFFSDGALDAAQSMKFLDSIMKQTGSTAGKSTVILDQLIKTMTAGPLDIGEMEKAWRSSAAAMTNMNLENDLPTFLALMTGARTMFNARRAGQSLNQFGASSLNMLNDKGKIAKAVSAMGIDKNVVMNLDPLALLDLISKQSQKKYQNPKLRMARLKDMLGLQGENLVIMYEKFNKLQGKSLLQIRNTIANSEGFANKYFNAMKKTAWYAQEVWEGTKESFSNVMGETFRPIMVTFLENLNKILGSLTTIIREHPALAKVLGYGVGLAGLLMAAGGSAMVVGGQILSMYGSIKNLGLQAALMRVQTIEEFFALKGQVGSVSDILGADLIPKLKTGMAMTLKFMGVVALLALAWHFDFLKIRTTTEKFFDNLKLNIDRAGQAIDNFKNKKISGSGLKELTQSLIGGGGWGEFRGRMIQAKIFFEGLGQAVNSFSKTGKFTITRQMMAMLTGIDENRLGDSINSRGKYMLDLFTDVVKVMANLDALWKGFVEGIKGAYPILSMFLGTILKPIWNIFYNIAKIGLRIAKVIFPAMADPDKNFFKSLGQALGGILSTIIAIKIGIMAWKVALRPIVGLARGIFGGKMGGGGILSGLTGKKESGKQHRSFLQWLFSVSPENAKRNATNWSMFRSGIGYKDGKAFSAKNFAGRNTWGGKLLRKGADWVGGVASFAAPILGTLLTGFLFLAQGESNNIYTNIKTNLKKVTPEGVKAFVAEFVRNVPIIAKALGDALKVVAQGIVEYIRSESSPEGFRKFFGIQTNNQVKTQYDTMLTNLIKGLTSSDEKARNKAITSITGGFGNAGMTDYYMLDKLQKDLMARGINTDFIEAKIQKIILNYLDMVDNPLAKFNRKINPGMYSIERERLLRSQAPTDFMRTYNIKPTTEAELRKRVKKHANGGWINGLTYSSLGEDGREVVIPLDKHRGRAVSLWKQAGQMIAPNETGRSGGGNLTTEVNFGEGSIVISVGDATPKTGKELARTMLTEIKKLIEQEQMRNYRMVRAR